MKKIFSVISVALMLASVTSCDWFKLDNLDGYNASIKGTIKDAQGDPVYTDHGNTIAVYEQNIFTVGGDPAPTSRQNWVVKSNGTYVNKLIFAAEYKNTTIDQNYFPIDVPFTVQKGENTQDFTVTPYAKVTSVNFSYDAAAKQIVAKVKVKGMDPKVTNLEEVRLMCHTSVFVGSSRNGAANDPSAFVQNVSPDGTQEITLKVTADTKVNPTEFKYTQPHYVRIAVRGKGAGVNGNNRYNFSAVYKVSEDFKTFTEVTEWL